MKTKRNRRRVRRSDYGRVLITETLPNEVPLIFSNEGFYKSILNKSLVSELRRILIDDFLCKESKQWSKPYKYKVRKNSIEFRQLGLVHPREQWLWADFYKQYDERIIELCGTSHMSIRAPKRVARTFYLPSDLNINNQVKGIDSADDQEEYLEYTTSYFAYRGYIRLYQFYSSPEFLTLEKKFSRMRTLDVARCFASIYTHTIAWAVTSKEFSKRNHKRQSFAKDFDRRMQYLNDGETNGILVGPEISRIFAEIILQRVDKIAELKLMQDGLREGIQFSIRRYVDDVIIFAAEQNDADLVYERYLDALSTVNLTANIAKSSHITRPFITSKSKSILEVTQETRLFLGEMFNLQSDSLAVKQIWRPERLAASFIQKVKLLCLANDATYDDVASYVIAILTRQLVDFVQANGQTLAGEAGEQAHRTLLALLDVLFFLYSVAPSVTASYTFGRALVVLIRFVRQRIPEWVEAVSERTIQYIKEFLAATHRSIHKLPGSHVSLETINVLLIAAELGNKYGLEESSLRAVFVSPEKAIEDHGWTYFEFIACFYAMGSAQRCPMLYNEVLGVLEKRLADLTEVNKDSELAHLVLDMSVCPHIDVPRRQMWIRRLFVALGLPKPTDAKIADYLADSQHWFVNWCSLDILNILQKKELSPAY